MTFICQPSSPTWFRDVPPALASPESIDVKLAAFRVGIFSRNDIVLGKMTESAVTRVVGGLAVCTEQQCLNA